MPTAASFFRMATDRSVAIFMAMIEGIVRKQSAVIPSKASQSAVNFAAMIKDFDAQLYKLVDAALQEDVGDGDHSTLCCIPADVKGKAVLKIKQDGVLAGMDVAEKIFRYKKPGCHFSLHKADGEEMRAGDTAFEVETFVH